MKKNPENRIFIALGSNKGNRLGYIKSAIDALKKNTFCTVVAVSKMYESKPFGAADQSNFFNCALEIRSSLDETELLRYLKKTELEVGRTPEKKWGPREIDIDIILYGSKIFNTSDLVIPHPHFKERDFVLLPLIDLDKDLCDPESGEKISNFLNKIEKFVINSFKL
ncbi:MAG: 2-amino-4-hydroxy-6-hydroxymethyldihydropteridine diphosphokinase [Bacteroidetes bacterium]|nr:2-amino-4-hydroxy-6-hydroxymethyldihydropteridine diphosphokinase [Bacteroidota bacterium]MBU1680653.1 2-amino-4-hydroxy-6-hydroxymethyldihydropteridine diphosphokinase [Bacteroidota bacterium]MBU2506518.1 2-amino-4-hydroxy-6-hydroxymethyldihydropteridine diphosphokinase [Bacteroidota bacterium]